MKNTLLKKYPSIKSLNRFLICANHTTQGSSGIIGPDYAFSARKTTRRIKKPHSFYKAPAQLFCLGEVYPDTPFAHARHTHQKLKMY